MPSPVIPWQPSNFPGEIQSELNRRKVNRSFKYIANTKASWDEDGDWNTYRGPMVSWIRLCSNSAGHPLIKKPRFVFYSGKGFYQSYGFQPPNSVGGSKTQIIGYTPTNPPQPHFIENDLQKPASEPVNYPIHVPPPEISRIEVTVQKELYRKAHVEWVAFSWKQLVYLTPYFLVPGITCMLEWGWNHYNVQSLVDLADEKQMRTYWDNAYPLYSDNILISKGNYDVIYGFVTNFNWSIEGNKIICTTEITSKDRLYAGIAKDYGLTVKADANDKEGQTGGMFQSIKDFLGKDDTCKSLKSIVTTTNPAKELIAEGTATPQDKKWIEILNPLLTTKDPQISAMKRGYVFGLFAGRPEDSRFQKENFGGPRDGDWDKTVQDKDPDSIWINVGMVVEILNHFSALESGAKNGKNMFYVDIQNTVIGGHPNLISCDKRVLIPNYQAPKFGYGAIGLQDASNVANKDLEKTPYGRQYINPASKKQSSKRVGWGTKSDWSVSTTFYQNPWVYRDNLDEIVNYNRKRYVNITTNDLTFTNSWSFPSAFTAKTPDSPSGLKSNEVEKDFSGLLSNIYISFAAFKDAVDTVSQNHTSFPDIYKSIFQTLMSAADNFWDLSLVDVDGTLTIVDRNYVGKHAFNQQKDKMFAFDYYDADSLIKTLKFRPALSDAQATRTIYGNVNNPNAQFQYLDRNDILNYQFSDAIIGEPNDKAAGDTKSELFRRRRAAIEEKKTLVRTVQRINADKDDGSLQMSLNPRRNNRSAPGAQEGQVEIIKLCLNGTSGQQLLRMLLNDGDEDNNQRYCAVQPNIILEMTIQGIGGLRTFQYFLIRNLPPPYSDREIVFRITDVIQTLESGNWETTIRAQPLPLKAYIKKRVRGPIETGPCDETGWPIENNPAITKAPNKI